MIDDNIVVMGRLMTDEEIVQDIIVVVEEEVQEENEEDTDETLKKSTAEKICKAIDTLLNFSMFTNSNEIGMIAMKASTLFEIELCESMKQTSNFGLFQKKKNSYTILNPLVPDVQLKAAGLFKHV